MYYADRDLLAKIESLRTILDKRDLYDVIRRTIELEANSHSDRMEHPEVSFKVKLRDGKTELRSRPMKRGELRRHSHESVCKTLQQLNTAWDWAVGEYSGTVTDHLIQDIAYKLEPIEWGYRRSNVRISGLDSIMPPRWEKVRDQMGSLVETINNQTILPIDRAILAHLQIARIHPFIDGNGRTARVVQNLILHYHHYTPPIIRTNERLAYQILLRSALTGYRDRTSDGKEHSEPTAQEIVFVDLMAYNIHETMKRAIGESDPQPTYIIDLTVKERSQVYTSKRIIDGYLRKHNLGTARIEDVKNGHIAINAQVSEPQLKGILSRCPILGYQLLPKKHHNT